MSILGDILGGDEEDSDATSTDGGMMGGTTSDDGLMPAGGSGGGGDMMGGGGDMMGGGGDMMGGGDMSFDGMDDGGGGGGAASEMATRVSDIENEVGSLASTVNTVQSENENISESLTEIEDSIRQLLEVYEMVTQGVNPFVEGESLSDSMGGGASGSGDFGGGSLFDSGEDEETGDGMDDDIASANAEAFLDEDIIDDEDEFGGDFEEDMSTDTDSDGDDEDLSFDELKAEFDSGDADWGDDGSDDSEFDEPATEADSEPAPDPFAEEEPVASNLEPEPAFDGEPEPEPAPESAFEAEPEPELTSTVDAELEPETASGHAAWDDGGRPYLEAIPSEYSTEFVVMEWLDYLVEEAGLNGAARTIRFYGSIQWVSESVEQYLQTMLNGFGGGPDLEDPEPNSSLGVNHKRSLWRISQISTPGKKRLPFDQWLEDEGIETGQLFATPVEESNEIIEAGGDTEARAEASISADSAGEPGGEPLEAREHSVSTDMYREEGIIIGGPEAWGEDESDGEAATAGLNTDGGRSVADEGVAFEMAEVAEPEPEPEAEPEPPSYDDNGFRNEYVGSLFVSSDEYDER